MKERPILFSGPMVRAILEGRKTQTRRVVKQSPQDVVSFIGKDNLPIGEYGLVFGDVRVISKHVHCPFGQPGDHLWVRETWRIADSDLCGCEGDYCCTCGCNDQPIYAAAVAEGTKDYYSPWRPSIHMPRWASRITLEVTAVRVERLQDITGEDAKAEGAFRQSRVGDDPVSSEWTMTGDFKDWRYDTPREAFASLWQSINAKRPGCSWEDNPFVWVVEFKRVETEEREQSETPTDIEQECHTCKYSDGDGATDCAPCRECFEDTFSSWEAAKRGEV